MVSNCILTYLSNVITLFHKNKAFCISPCLVKKESNMQGQLSGPEIGKPWYSSAIRSKWGNTHKSSETLNKNVSPNNLKLWKKKIFLLFFFKHDSTTLLKKKKNIQNYHIGSYFVND